MTCRSQQWRFPEVHAGRLRVAVALAGLALAGFGVGPLHAQGGAPTAGADALCRCFAGDSTAGRDRGRDWAVLGAAGLVILAGIPFGSAGTPAIPFAEGPLAASPPGPLAEAPGAPPAGPAGTAPGGPTAAVPGSAPVTVELPVDVPMVPLGIVPPKTATHLPLLAAAGVLLMAGGGMLARRQARRQRRRRRRIVAI